MASESDSMNSPILQAIHECGKDFAKRDGSTEQSGVYNFLGQQPITMIASALTNKLNELGYSITGTVKVFEDTKRSKKLNGKRDRKQIRNFRGNL